MKLAGVRRYAATRGWGVETVPEAESGPERLRSLLTGCEPMGCIVECFGGESRLKPHLFGMVPAVWLDFPSELNAAFGANFRDGSPTVSVDEEAVASAALRELSGTRPVSLAAVEFHRSSSTARSRWSRVRAETFRSMAVAAGQECHVFESRVGETKETREARLADWLAARPRPCGVFAANDGTASEVRAACRAARLHVPRDISIIGVDNDTGFCEAESPTLSSVQIDFELAGYMAAKMLAARIGHMGAPQRGAPIGPLLVIRRESTRGRGRHEPRILEAMEMIRREACEGLTAAELAARFPGTRRLFNMRFREAMGHSVLDEILQVRLEKVLTLLAETDMAIGAIYAHCGFRSHWALDFLFHSRFNTSMREWRKGNRRK